MLRSRPFRQDLEMMDNICDHCQSYTLTHKNFSADIYVTFEVHLIISSLV